MAMMAEYVRETITFSVENNVATITLNRPRQFNTLNSQMFLELHDTVAEVSTSPEIGALILTGARKAYCLGIDANEASSWEPVMWNDFLPIYQEIIIALVEMPKPTIAAINGFATGAGLDLALACDLRIASRNAKMGAAFVKQGLVPDGGGSYFLPRIIGITKATELILMGEAISATEAARIGLVNKVVRSSEVLKEARTWALQIIGFPARAIALAKRNLRVEQTLDLKSALTVEAAAQKELLSAGALWQDTDSSDTESND
jgi:2-(1,2-epoxy-1,2-dihydrophenyl)acetyl-CoA isomerase